MYSKNSESLTELLDGIIDDLSAQLVLLGKQIDRAEREYKRFYQGVVDGIKLEIEREEDLDLRGSYASFVTEFANTFSEYDSAASGYTNEVVLFREFERNTAESHSQSVNLIGGATSVTEGLTQTSTSEAKRRVEELNLAKDRFRRAAEALDSFVSLDRDPADLVKHWQESRRREKDSLLENLRDRFILKVFSERELSSQGKVKEASSLFDNLD